MAISAVHNGYLLHHPDAGYLDNGYPSLDDGYLRDGDSSDNDQNSLTASFDNLQVTSQKVFSSFNEALKEQFSEFSWNVHNMGSVDSVSDEWIQIGRTLGEGAFGRVVQVNNAKNPEETRVLKISKQGLPLNLAGGELLSLKVPSHPNLMRVDGVFTRVPYGLHPQYHQDYQDFNEFNGREIVGTVASFHEAKDLMPYVTGKKSMARENIIETSIQTGRALRHLHDNQFVHRDVKPDNILLSEDGHATLIDMGLLSKIGEVTSRAAPWGHTPPEFFQKAYIAHEKVDAFGIGTTMAELALGRRFFDDTQKAIYAKALGHFVKQDPDSNLVAACTTPQERIELDGMGLLKITEDLTKFNMSDRLSVRDALQDHNQ